MLRQVDLPQQHLCAECADKHLCFPSLQDHEDLLNEARLRLINVQKVSVFEKFSSRHSRNVGANQTIRLASSRGFLFPERAGFDELQAMGFSTSSRQCSERLLDSGDSNRETLSH